MPCYRPIKGYRSRLVNESGKRSIVFNAKYGFSDQPVDLPCGQCIGCRLERSRQWAIRCSHEAQMHEDNSFVTLTFSDEHLPKSPEGVVSLDGKVFQDFMKRLRFRFGAGIRFFHCGEYGETFGRPHHHACLFNFDFKDKVEWRETRDGHKVWRSDALEELWPFGQSEIGSVSFESAAYVARYITKKVTGEGADAHYRGRKPEFVTMSRRPGIGKAWFDVFKSDVYPFDEVVLRGKEMKPPKYYDRQFELAYPSDFCKVKDKRKQGLNDRSVEEWYRLAVRERCHEARANLLKRGIE